MKVPSTSIVAILGASALLAPIDAVQGARQGWKPGQRAVVKKASALGSKGWHPGVKVGVDPVALDGSDGGIAEGDTEWLIPGAGPDATTTKKRKRFEGGFVERLTKQVLVDIFRRDPDEVEASFQAQKAPFSTLHPRIKEIHHSKSAPVEVQLGVPLVSPVQGQSSEYISDDAAAADKKQQEGEEGNDEWQAVNDFMQSAFGSSSSDSGSAESTALSFGEGKGPWVILVTSSGSNDKTSAQVNESFNRTLGLLYPDEVPKGEKKAVLSSIVEALPGSGSGSSAGDEPFEGADVEKAAAGVGSAQQREAVDDPIREAKVKELVERARVHLKDWRWGIASFENEASLSWHWQVWKIPIIFVITPSTSPSRSYDMRYWPVAWVQPSPEHILAVLTPPKAVEEGGEGGEAIWKRFKLWDSSFAPGGARAGVSDALAGGFEYVYRVTDRVPAWGLTFISGALATSVIGFMHRR